MTSGNALSWQPTPDAARRMLRGFTLGAGLIGVVGFSVSFWSVAHAAEPYMGWASWSLPVLVDLGIFVLSGLSMFLEMHEISSRWIRLIPLGLAGFTVYLNTAEQHLWFGKAVHAAGPALWVAVVEIGTYTVRRLVGLASENAMDRVRAIRWILAPVATFRLWRRMRLWEITSYRTAISREHERSANTALLRQWYGRGWRARSPRAERLAVRLHGLSDEPVANLLTRASAGITAAALAAVKPGTEAPSTEAAPDATGAASEALRPLDPILYGREQRAGGTFTAQVIPFAPRVSALTDDDDETDPDPEPIEPAGDAWDAETQAIALRAAGHSFAQIASQLGRSKTWAFNVARTPIEQVNGHHAA